MAETNYRQDLQQSFENLKSQYVTWSADFHNGIEELLQTLCTLDLEEARIHLQSSTSRDVPEENAEGEVGSPASRELMLMLTSLRITKKRWIQLPTSTPALKNYRKNSICWDQDAKKRSWPAWGALRETRKGTEDEPEIGHIGGWEIRAVQRIRLTDGSATMGACARKIFRMRIRARARQPEYVLMWDIYTDSPR